MVRTAALIQLYHTVKFLRFKQIYYRLFYLLRSRWRRVTGFSYPLAVTSNVTPIALAPSIQSVALFQNRRADFLNIVHDFGNGIDWNIATYGKLWTYNLTYFDYLHHGDTSKEEGMALIYDFVKQMPLLKDALEPFPIALRGINWIKFLTYHHIDDHVIDDALYAQYHILMDNLEYHLLGNHLLENGFSLLFGGIYFQDAVLRQKASEILYAELDEQILDDGAHFELSPMYHQIMLFRLLECINLLQHNPVDASLQKFLETKASLMLGWLRHMTFQDGTIPLFNDSTNNIAPSSRELFDYARRLNLEVTSRPLGQSGYRKFSKDRYECIVDVGSIGARYIAGHAHADTFGFELHVNNRPFIVDTGISTYEANAQRMTERATVAHNTVSINNESQSELWGAFRVAERAEIISFREDADTVTATHNGYEKRYGVLHQREFIGGEKQLTLIDTIVSDREYRAVARVHFHPDITDEEIARSLRFEPACEYTVREYRYAPEFNLHVKAKVVEVVFTQKLKTVIAL